MSERGQQENQESQQQNRSNDSTDYEQRSNGVKKENDRNEQSTSHRGFAAMDPEKQREIASEGGRAAHKQGVAHEWSSEEAREAGKKGGQIVSRNREHMSEIGRRGGQSSGSRRNQQNEGS